MSQPSQIPAKFINHVVIGDARQLLGELPDNSVDMIFTDPPYHQKYLYLYDLLAKQGSRILKPGCWAFIYGGWVAPEIYDILGAGEWQYFMTIAVTNRASNPRWWSKKLLIGFKPIYVFTKGEPIIHSWQNNLIDTNTIDKRYHKWGQGIGSAITKIEQFTNPGGIVLDPFCGGGQTAEASKITGRNFVTFEIDKDTAKVARDRINQQKPLLFAPQPKQKELPILEGSQ